MLRLFSRIIVILLVLSNCYAGANIKLGKNQYVVFDIELQVKEKPDNTNILTVIHAGDVIEFNNKKEYVYIDKNKNKWLYIDTHRYSNDRNSYYSENTFKGWINKESLLDLSKLEKTKKFFNINANGYIGDTIYEYVFKDNGSYLRYFNDGKGGKDSIKGQLYNYKNFYTALDSGGLYEFFYIDTNSNFVCPFYNGENDKRVIIPLTNTGGVK
jgi:hypothetical protein